MSSGQNKVDNNPIFYVVFFYKIHTSPGAACVSRSDTWVFSSFMSRLFQKSALLEEVRGQFWCLIICRTSGLGEIVAPTKTSSCQTDETQSWLMIWLVPRLFGVLPTRWHAVLCADVSGSAVPPRVPSGACTSAFLSTCFVVNRPIRLCTVSYRGQAKECKKGSQWGHQRANQSFMDFPVKDNQQGSPSSCCGSRFEVFLGPSVSI